MSLKHLWFLWEIGSTHIQNTGTILCTRWDKYAFVLLCLNCHCTLYWWMRHNGLWCRDWDRHRGGDRSIMVLLLGLLLLVVISNRSFHPLLRCFDFEIKAFVSILWLSFWSIDRNFIYPHATAFEFKTCSNPVTLRVDQYQRSLALL